MSKLRTYELQNPDSASVNIELTPSGGTVLSGVVTATTLKVGTGVTISSGVVSADSFSGPLTGNVTGNVTGDITGNVTGNVTGDITGNLAGTTTIAGISSSISDTAVDVFVYDTRKDSDGGAWRKRTQHTSWYNETLNTATRGSRREFPAVAVIVVESLKVTIYDGDDPDLPMWMVFNAVSSGGVVSTSVTDNLTTTSYAMFWVVALTATSAVNGVISVVNSNYVGTQIKFVSDDLILMTGGFASFPSALAKYSLPVSGRNSPGVYKIFSAGLLSGAQNDVAMTVLPNAPIDDATGLPVPTIAVGTDGGVSIIKDDGNVYDYTRTGNNTVSSIDFDDNNQIVVFNSTTQGIYYNIPIPSSDVVNNDYNGQVLWTGGTPASLVNGSTAKIIGGPSNALFRGATNGIHILTNYNLTTNGMVAYATTSYNTGWMHGDIKGAFLSDTTIESFSPSNLVTEDFSANWAGSTNGVISVSSGQLTITNTGGSNGRAVSNQFATTTGKKYAFIAKGISSTGGGEYRSEVRGPELVATSLTAGTLVLYFNGTGNSTTYVELYAIGGDGVTVTYEDAYVVELEEDRSVNNKGLQVFGTITKSAVATGADLVSYSGFSASNYLEQPYNSDLNYGTGDFYFGGWFKGAGYSDSLIGRLHDSSSAGKGFLLSTASSGASGVLVFAIYTLGFQSSGRTSINSGTNETGKGWQQVWGIRRGGTMELWLNGNLVTTASNSDDISDTTYNPPLFIGVQHGSSVFDGELALMRTGASAPSAEQIKKIYEDEKVLFQENAACTLYGSSDAVTALAYDDSTNLLYAGTSSGRSDFQGLRRINNTTTAVTTAISASNGLVAEQ